MIRLLVAPGSLAREDYRVTGEDHHYLFRVRRLRVGDQVVLFDGEGAESTAEIHSVRGDHATLILGEVSAADPARARRLTMLVSLIKGERMELCVEKLVELGVGRIVPVVTERTVVKLDPARAEKRLLRFRATVRAAAQQCRIPFLPSVSPIVPLAAALAGVEGDPLKLMFWEEATDISLRQVLPAAPPERLALLIGPEGGFTEAEVERGRGAGFQVVGLGPRIMRAETAAVAAAAICSYIYGDV